MGKQKSKSKKFKALCKKYGVDPNLVPEIMTVEAAFKATGKKMPKISSPAKDEADYLNDHYISVVLAEAIRGNWKPDFLDNNWKYEARFYLSGSGFAYAGYGGWHTSADCGSRLCFPNPDQAIFYGKHFVKQHGKWMMKGK